MTTNTKLNIKLCKTSYYVFIPENVLEAMLYHINND